jgi:pimeloyl-ACP methyl ester carboxylesterase
MPFASTDDKQEIYYEVHGSTGPILMMISGYMGITDIWRPILARLNNRFRCVVHDNRGFGRSSKPDSANAYSIPRHADDIKSILLELNIDEKIIMLTHSVGGNIASAYCLAHPERVAGIISSGTYFDGKLVRPFLPLETLIHRADEPSQAVAFYSQIGLMDEIALEAAKWPAYARRHNARALLDFDIGDGYTRIKTPMLLIHGDQDLATPLESLVKPIQHAVPSCWLEVLKGVKHFPPTEAPEKMEKLIDEFVLKRCI